MKSDSVAFGVAGILFGLIAGWVIGSQQAALRQPAAAVQAAQATGSTAAVLDQVQVNAYISVAEREPSNAAPRVQLGNLYFDAEQFDDAIKWYTDALRLTPNDTKTLLNVGFIKAFGKQDLQGAQDAWEQVIKLAPQSPEAQAARRALDSLRAAHPPQGAAQKPGA